MCDIHNYKLTFKREERNVRKAKISKRNKQLILEFGRYCLASGIGYARIQRFYQILRDVCLRMKKDLDSLRKRDIYKLLEMIEERDFSFGKKYTNYWQHMALLCRAGDGPVMIDVTNGNVPFLFLEGEEAEALIDSDRFVSVRMVDEVERFYYHRVPQDIPEALLMLMRDWIGAIDLIHVFEDDLGLLIRSDFFVYPLPWRDEAELEAEVGRWMGIVSEQGFKGFELLSDPRSPGPIWSELASKLPKAFSGLVEGREYLRERFNRFYADGRPFEISLAAVKA